MSSAPLVSVVVPTYNAIEFLPRTLESLFRQTWQDFEVIVIDDGSTDGTSGYLGGLSEPRLRLEPNPANLGIAASRNRGLSLARGRYVAWLDADDLALPRRLELQVKYLEAHPEAVLCCTNVVSIDRNDRKLSKPWWGRHGQPPLEWELCWTNPIAQSSVMVRRAVLGDLQYEREKVPAEDYLFWTQLAAGGRLHRLPKVLTLYRILEGSAFHSRKEWATQSAFESNMTFVGRLGGTPPAFHSRLTSFYWKPWAPRSEADFLGVVVWMESVLSALSRNWSRAETGQAKRDLNLRLFRFFFSPESEPPSVEALFFFRQRAFPLWLLAGLKRLFRRLKGRVQ